MQKSSRYTIGERVENKFLDLLESAHSAYFSPREQKDPHISKSIFIADTLTFLITVAWEGKLIANGHFEQLAKNLDETGRMLGGWKQSLTNPEKKNRDL